MPTYTKGSFLVDSVRRRLIEAGWKAEDILVDQTIVKEGARLRPDIVLMHNLLPLAVIEMKSAVFDVGGAVQQMLLLKQVLEVPFAFVIGGENLFRLEEPGTDPIRMSNFPSPHELLSTSQYDKNDPLTWSPLAIETAPPKLHQVLAIRQVISEVKRGEKRILLVIAVGGGKTYVTAQIAWKLIRSGFLRRVLLVSESRDMVNHWQKLLSQSEWAVSADLEWLLGGSSAPSVQISSVDNLMRVGKTSRLQDIPSDLFDLIIIEDAPARDTRSVSSILQHFTNAAALLVASRQPLGAKSLGEFGQPVFSYSLQDAIAKDLLEAPAGFVVRKIDELAEIRAGILIPKVPADLIDSDKERSFIIRSKDIGEDGSISMTETTKIDLAGTRYMREDSEVDARFCLKPSDILVSSFPLGSSYRVGFVPDTIPPRTTFSNSVILVRVNPDAARPDEVFAFLRSNQGQTMLRSFSTSGVTMPRITSQGFAQLPVWLPETAKKINIERELSAAAKAKEQLENEILPTLRELSKKGKGGGEQDEQLGAVAQRLQGVAILLAPPQLPDRVVSKYPMPIALAFRRYRDARFNVYEQVLRLRDVFEATSHFVYNVLLADALRRLDPQLYYVQDRGARRAFNGYSMASRMDFVHSVIELAVKRDPQELFVPEIVDSDVAKVARELQEDFRNRLSHTATATESQQKKVLADFEPKVLAMLEDLDFLTRYRLVRIPSFYFLHGQLMRRMEIYHGVVPELDEQPIPDPSSLTQADRDHLVLLDDEDKVLDLHPLYQLLASQETRHENHLCFFKQRRAGQMLLEGESVQGAFPVRLEGFQDFEALQDRILDTSPEEQN